MALVIVGIPFISYQASFGSISASALAAPLLLVTTADAVLRIWRSAWAWMPVDRCKGLFRLAWVVVSVVGLVALVAASVAVLLA